jgi:hypothetical protein
MVALTDGGQGHGAPVFSQGYIDHGSHSKAAFGAQTHGFSFQRDEAQQGQAAYLRCQASLGISESLAPIEAIFSNFST